MANVLGFNSVEHSINEVDDRKIDVEISRDKDVLSTTPGATDVKIMKIFFKTHEDEMALNGLKLKVSGTISENIEKAVLKNGEEILAEGRAEEGFISFENVGYKLDKNSEGFVYVFINASKNLRAGERIRLSIEDPGDAYVMVGGELFDLKNSFPLKGKPLSVVSMRGWEPGYSAPKSSAQER
jgi:hypothetical protein